jgi:hypothetical protein
VEDARGVDAKTASQQPVDRQGDRCALFDSACRLQLFALQFQLFDLTEDLLALRAEEHAL